MQLVSFRIVMKGNGKAWANNKNITDHALR